MSILAASKKAKMNYVTARYHYHKYFKQQNPDIPAPNHITTYKHYTQEQIKEVIGYIIDDKMSINAASRKTNISPDAGRRHYRQYLKDNDTMVPVQKHSKHYTQVDINNKNIHAQWFQVEALMVLQRCSLNNVYVYYTQSKYDQKELIKLLLYISKNTNGPTYSYSVPIGCKWSCGPKCRCIQNGWLYK
jgi:hypothetical protein